MPWRTAEGAGDGGGAYRDGIGGKEANGARVMEPEPVIWPWTTSCAGGGERDIALKVDGAQDGSGAGESRCGGDGKGGEADDEAIEECEVAGGPMEAGWGGGGIEHENAQVAAAEESEAEFQSLKVPVTVARPLGENKVGRRCWWRRSPFRRGRDCH